LSKIIYANIFIHFDKEINKKIGTDN